LFLLNKRDIKYLCSVKNKLLKNIIAIVLAQIVLFASTSFVLNFHLCENHIHSFSLIGKAASCVNMTCDLSSRNGSMQMKKSCCSDKQIKSSAQQFDKARNIEIPITYNLNFVFQQDDISTLKHNLKKDYFIGYTTPLQTFNFNDLYQIYLI